MKRKQAAGNPMGKYTWFVFLLLVCLGLTGCSSDNFTDLIHGLFSDETQTIGEDPVNLQPAYVNITEEQYQQFAEIQEELKQVILYGRDSGKLEDLYDLFPLDDFQKAGSCYLSSVPWIKWDYKHNTVYEIKLLAFSEDQSVCYFILLSYQDGKIDYQYGGYENMGVEILQNHPVQKMVDIKADYYKSCFLTEDNRIYSDEELITAKTDFSAQFDFDRMGVSYQEATDPNVCAKVDLNGF